MTLVRACWHTGQNSGFSLVRMRQSWVPLYTPLSEYPAPSKTPTLLMISLAFFDGGVGIGVPFLMRFSHLPLKFTKVVMLGSHGSMSCGYMGIGSFS